MTSIAPSALPVAGFWRLLYLKTRIWLGQRLFAQFFVKPPRKGGPLLAVDVINISPFTCVKLTSNLNEVAVLSFLSKEGILPVPKVYGAWRLVDRPSQCYLMMQRLPGVTLEDAWKSLRNRDRKKLAQELRRHLQHLHAIPQPSHIGGSVASFVGGPIKDAALSCLSAKGPFPDTPGFLDHLLGLVNDEYIEEHGYLQLLSAESSSRLQLTHGDLSPRNIIIDPRSMRITGIIDWNTCAWMPLYWERFKATFTRSKSATRVAFFDEAAGTWAEELQALRDATSLERGFR